MSILSNPIFSNESKARSFFERLIYPDGLHCVHCNHKKYYKTSREGRYRCASKSCRKDFSATTGTVFESSHIQLHKWLAAFYLVCSSKKGISSHQLHRTLKITYKSAWFMSHRIREAMKSLNMKPLGGEGKIVEIDEAFYGKLKGQEKRIGTPSGYLNTFVTIAERGGDVRSFQTRDATYNQLSPIVVHHLDKKSTLMSDKAGSYKTLGQTFAKHEMLNHSLKEFFRANAHTASVDSFFALFKRGMRGVYQHCGENHLQRYLTEFDFRWNNRHVDDGERTLRALAGAKGKRLRYRVAC